MEYEKEVNLEAYSPDVEFEQAGVTHLVHGWIQQNQPKKVKNINHGSLILINILTGAFHIRRHFRFQGVGCNWVPLRSDKVDCQENIGHVQGGFPRMV